jgi:hypothetical protein
MIVGARSLHHHHFLLRHVRWCGQLTTPRQPSKRCELRPSRWPMPPPDRFKPCSVCGSVLGQGYFARADVTQKRGEPSKKGGEMFDFIGGVKVPRDTSDQTLS